MLFKLRKILLTVRDYIKSLLGFKKRIVVLVDGFNLYHSLIESSRNNKDNGKLTKWFNIASYCRSKLPNISKSGRLHKLYYFSAYAYQRIKSDPETVNRHKALVKALEWSGFEIIMGQFKKKSNFCNACGKKQNRYEEKETDVNISIKLLELAVYDRGDIFVIMSGDTDLIPAINNAKRLAPEKEFWIIFPYKRINNELKKIVDGHISIKHQEILKHQFQDPVILSDGTTIAKPASW